MLADSNVRLEVDALAAEPRRHAVAAAIGALCNQDGLTHGEAVFFDERLDVLVEPRAAVHRLDREVAGGELALSLRAEERVALLEHQREALLVVDAARGADLEDREAALRGAMTRDRVRFDLVHDRALDVVARAHTAGRDEDVALAGGRERGERRLHDHCKRQHQTADLFAHPREE